MKINIKKLLLFNLFFCLYLCANSNAGMLNISPGSFCLEKIDIGVDENLGIDLVVSTKDSNHNVFLVRTDTPFAKNVLKGYIPIPDASWLYFSNDRLTLDKNGVGKARMFFKIPNEEKYLNQHWIVETKVKPAPVGGDLFLMQLTATYMIETRASADVKERPYGILGIVPSRVNVKNIIPEKVKQAAFKIYNNDKIAHTYSLSTHTFMPALKKKLSISIAPGYEWVRDTNWVKPVNEKITVKPGGIKQADLNIKIPKNVEYEDEGWEAIVMVEPDNGRAGFVRVLME
ncbi:Secreted protein [Candidatus Magnetomoraceae bacterium gMMP-1]